MAGEKGAECCEALEKCCIDDKAKETCHEKDSKKLPGKCATVKKTKCHEDEKPSECGHHDKTAECKESDDCKEDCHDHDHFQCEIEQTCQEKCKESCHDKSDAGCSHHEADTEDHHHHDQDQECCHPKDD